MRAAAGRAKLLPAGAVLAALTMTGPSSAQTDAQGFVRITPEQVEDRHAVVLQGTWYTGTGDDFAPDRTLPLKAGSYMMHPAGARHLDGAKDEEDSPSMSFFITSVGRGFGGNLAGLAGADAHCQQLARTVGRGDRTWRAYLSAPATGGQPAVHARDRIGRGPWFNAKGEEVASSVAHLHSDGNALGLETSLSEKGTIIGPGRHDILTGSNTDGTLAAGGRDTTCQGWTSHTEGRAMLGHHNRTGGGQNPASWNSAHLSRGCSQAALRASLGDGLTYCFAAD